MARAKAGSGFLILRPPPRKRYVLICSRCFMRLHDTAKVAFTLLDRWSGRTRVLN